jgi:hypothetical protein
MPTCPNCSNPADSKTKFCLYCDAPIEITYTPTKDTTGTILGASNQISALVKRYKDAYLVAKVTDGFGAFIKVIGIVAAVLLLLVGLSLAGSGRAGDATFALGVVLITFGIIAGLWFYIVGVLVSANAQVLKAALDGAVNSSPFLTNEHRAKIMSLPEA